MTPFNAENRRRGRLRAAQFLYSLEFNGYNAEAALAAFWEMNPAKPAAREYAEMLLRGILRTRAELDSAIDESLENWVPSRVGRAERNILRIGVYELRHSGDVPPKVAINEAVELAKEIGAEDAPRFVNGVLDRIHKGAGG